MNIAHTATECPAPSASPAKPKGAPLWKQLTFGLAKRAGVAATRLAQQLDHRVLRSCRFEAARDRTELLFTHRGPESFLVLTADTAISKAVYCSGAYDLDKVYKALEWLGPSFTLDTLVDVGANIGTICIPVIKRKLARRAIAFEPNPVNYRTLVANVYINDLADKIDTINLALGSADDQLLEFELSETNSGDHRIRVDKAEEGIFSEHSRRTIKVKADRFDTHVADLNPDSSLIWMDTQGYEGNILEGAQHAIQRQVPMVLEFWPYGMKRARSYEALRRALSNYCQFYDLAETTARPQPIAMLDALFARFEADGRRYTDILVTR